MDRSRHRGNTQKDTGGNPEKRQTWKSREEPEGRPEEERRRLREGGGGQQAAGKEKIKRGSMRDGMD